MKKIMLLALLAACSKSTPPMPACDTSKLKNFGLIVNAAGYTYYGDYLRDTGYYNFRIHSDVPLSNCEVIDRVK